MTSIELRCVPFDESILVDYEHLTQGCGLVDLSGRTQIELRGADRQRFLHNLCTNEILALEPGHGCEAFVTSVQGKCLGHVFVFAAPETLVVETTGGQADALIAHWDRYLITEDVQIADRSSAWGELLVAGPAAATLLRQWAAQWALDEIGRHQRIVIESYTTWVRRVPLTAQPTFLVACDAGQVAVVAERLRSAGAVECHPAALHMARVEHGFPWYSWDITAKNLPQEVNRNDQAISFKKGCYLGQETVARIDALGHVNRLLVALRCDPTGIPPAGTSVAVEGQVVGEVTSAAYSPRLQAPLALAYLRTAHTQPGTQLVIGDRTAEVTALPRNR